MAKVTLNQLKQWFVTGSKPLQAQYYNWMDSYWHKDEFISQNQIDGLATSLGNKADADQFQYYAKSDATNIDAVKWRNVLGVGNVDLSNYYTKPQVDNLISNVTVDLSGYYTKTEVDGKLTAVYKTKGSVANYAALPTTGRVYGDVWNLIDTGDNYVWVASLNNTGSAGWDKLSGVVDLSAYHTITQYQSWVNSNFPTITAVNNKVDKTTSTAQSIASALTFNGLITYNAPNTASISQVVVKDNSNILRGAEAIEILGDDGTPTKYTEAELDAAYPLAVSGFELVCPNISTTNFPNGVIYKKTTIGWRVEKLHLVGDV